MPAALMRPALLELVREAPAEVRRQIPEDVIREAETIEHVERVCARVDEILTRVEARDGC
jgi:hypothetical protein